MPRKRVFRGVRTAGKIESGGQTDIADIQHILRPFRRVHGIRPDRLQLGARSNKSSSDIEIKRSRGPRRRRADGLGIG